MSKSTFANMLLSLFTTPEIAESIEGDLTEEYSNQHGIWIWLASIRVTFALFRYSFRESPIQTSALGAVTYSLVLSAVFFTAAILQQVGENYTFHPFVMFIVAVMITSMPSFIVGVLLVKLFPVLAPRALLCNYILIFFAIVVLQMQGLALMFREELKLDIGVGTILFNSVASTILSVLAIVVITLQAITPITLGFIAARRSGF